MDFTNSTLLTLILIGLSALSLFTFFFRKQIKKVWFRLPFFEGGIETHASTKIPVTYSDNLSYGNGRKLRRIDDIETGKSIKNLPQGVYGYAHASNVDSALGLFAHHGDLELTNSQKTNWYFEIRKGQGDILLVGYISRDALSKIKDGNNVSITVFAQPYEEFQNKIYIPFSKITSSSARTIDTKIGEIRILEIKTSKIIVL